MNINLELSINQGILFDQNISAKDMTLFGLKLYDQASLINTDDIDEVTVTRLPDGAINRSYKNGKWYYYLNGQQKEYTLDEMIKTALHTHGWLFMRSGFGYRVKMGNIVEFRIGKDLLHYYQVTKKEDVVEKFGKPDSIHETIDPHIDEVITTKFVYLSRMVRIFYDEWKMSIKSINIGEEWT